MKMRTILKKARGFIAKPQHWTQGIREDHGAYCALGALDKAFGGEYACDFTPTVSFLRSIMTKRELSLEPGDCQNYSDDAGKVAKFNNAASHREVLRLFDRAIKRCNPRANAR